MTLEKSPKKDSLQTEFNFPTSSQGASRVNRSRSRANKKERVTTDISGQICFASSRHSNRGTLLARMSEELLTSKTAWSSRLCALTWKVKDTKFNRSLFQLQASVLPIEEKEFGLLPTPVSSDAGAGAIIGKDDKFRITKNGNLRKINRNNKDGSLGLGKRATLGVLQNPELIKEMNLDGKTYQEVKMWRTPDAHCDRGASSEKRMKMKLEKGMPISINDQVAHPNLMWPTPTQDSATDRSKKYSQGGKPLTLAVQEAEKMWPTPVARDWKGSSGRSYKGLERDLPTAVKMMPKPTARDWKDSGLNTNYETARKKSRLAGTAGGSLNPTWVEWLMGYPAGYTDLKDWEILSSRKLRKKSVKQS